LASIFDFPSRRAWAWLGYAGLAAYGGLALAGFSVKLRPIMIGAAVCAIFACGGCAYLRLRPHKRLFSMFMGLSYFTAIGISAGVLSFAMVPFTGILWDARFVALERGVGIDWPALVAFMASNAIVNHIWAFAYSSAFAQILFALFLLPGFGHEDRLAAYLKLMAATLVVVAVITLLVPVAGPVEAYGLTEQARHQVGPPSYAHLDQFFELREGKLTTFDLANMAGMVSFPSFHTIVAILTAWALWPLRIVGPIALLLNAILIVSTVPWGGHYLIDIPAGAAIAVLGIMVIAHRGKFILAPMKAAPLAAERL
jgi:hypothetical protein